MSYVIKLKLKDILMQRDINQVQLSEMTGLRQSTISDLVRGNRTGINKDHLGKICEALEIKDIREILDFDSEEEK